MTTTSSLPSRTSGPSALPVWALALLGIAALTALRIAVLFASGLELYGDEAQYWTYGQDLAFGYYSKPPMIGWLARATTELGGHGEAWVRLSSPLIQGLTALLLFAFAQRLYGSRIALAAALAYASLPAVSYASLLLSTDTPLLLFWVLGLIALWRLQDGGSVAWSFALGLALGGGLLSKYAMAYLLLGLAVNGTLSPAGRSLLMNRRLWLGLALGLLLFAPNLWWNMTNGGATVVHVAENANLNGQLWNPRAAAMFFLSQFGIVGPVFMAAFLIRLALVPRQPLDDRERFLIAFSLPVLLIIQGQALLAGANANWAATAVPGAVVLAVAWLLQLGRRLWMKVALTLNAAAFLGLVVLAIWPALATPVVGERALRNVRGWAAFAEEVTRRAAACGCQEVLFDRRFELAQFWYYGGLDPSRLRMRVNNDVSNHYELTRPFAAPATQRTLYVTNRAAPTDVLRTFGRVAEVADFQVTTGPSSLRSYRAYVIDPVSHTPTENPQ